MFNFNSYVSSFFGGDNNNSKKLTKKDSAAKAEAVLATLQKQITLLSPEKGNYVCRFPDKKRFEDQDGIIVIDPTPIMEDAETVKTGQAFADGMDRMTGTTLIDQLIDKKYKKLAKQVKNYPPCVIRTFYAITAAEVANYCVKEWPGFAGPVTKALKPSAGTDALALYTAANVINRDNVFSILHANYYNGGSAGCGPFQESIFKLFSKLCVPQSGENLLEAIVRAYDKLHDLMRNPEDENKNEAGEDGEDGENKAGENKDGEDGENKAGENKDGEDGEGEAGEDGEGEEGENKEGKIGDKPMTDEEILKIIKEWKKENKETKTDSNPEQDISEMKLSDPATKAWKIGSKTLSSMGGKIAGCAVTPEQRIKASKISKVIDTTWLSLGEFNKLEVKNTCFQRKYQEWIKSHRLAITKVADAIHFPANTESMDELGLRSGQIDEGALWTIGAGLSDGRLFQKTVIIGKTNKVIVILLDMSGSMNGVKMKEASDVCLIFIEAMKSLSLDGVDLLVYGHTGDTNELGTLDMIKIVDATTDESHMLASSDYFTLQQNYDGFAIQAAIDETEKLYPFSADKSMFVISDGEPAAHKFEYLAGTGIAHTNMVIDKNRAINKWNIFGIGICDAFPQETGDAIYGKGNCVILKDTLGSIPILARHIKKICE